MAHDVFVSYSNKDKPIADAVMAGLENNGIRCWIARRDRRKAAYQFNFMKSVSQESVQLDA